MTYLEKLRLLDVGQLHQYQDVDHVLCYNDGSVVCVLCGQYCGDRRSRINHFHGAEHRRNWQRVRAYQVEHDAREIDRRRKVDTLSSVMRITKRFKEINCLRFIHGRGSLTIDESIITFLSNLVDQLSGEKTWCSDRLSMELQLLEESKWSIDIITLLALSMIKARLLAQFTSIRAFRYYIDLTTDNDYFISLIETTQVGVAWLRIKEFLPYTKRIPQACQVLEGE